MFWQHFSMFIWKLRWHISGIALTEVMMKDQDLLEKLQKMSLEEKLSLLCEAEKAYISGYIDRALFEQQKKGNGEQGETKNEE
jgi:hypothetical protein